MESRKGRAALSNHGFLGFLTSQALGAFNDNAFKTFVALWAVATLPAQESARLIALAGAFFIIPFLLFSTYAGWVADRWGKKRLIVFFKAAELALLAASFPALWSRNIPSLMVLLFLMGTHSAFFGPVKLAIIPEMIEDEDLSCLSVVRPDHCIKRYRECPRSLQRRDDFVAEPSLAIEPVVQSHARRDRTDVLDEQL